MELAGIDILTEREARDELARTSILVRKQRIVFRVKEMFMMKKYQDKINLLEKQLTNNSYLWDQLAESQKRERVLKQELLYT
jgi:multidrug efflux pump subunit AcrA (membrane-fusion protein)